MVCIPCVAIPIFLVIYKFIIMPLIQYFWKLTTGEEKKAELVKDCKNGVCTLSWKKNEEEKNMTENKNVKVE